MKNSFLGGEAPAEPELRKRLAFAAQRELRPPFFNGLLKSELVKLRYFAGLTIQEAATALGISTATADRYWAYACAWIQTEMTPA